MNEAMQQGAVRVTPQPKPDAKPRRAPQVVALALAVVALVVARPATYHARALALLSTFSDPTAAPAVTDEAASFKTPDGREIRARLYVPAGSSTGSRPGVVLVHGVHHLGIEEPRLRRFARALAAAGITVLTPEVTELSDYHVASASIDTVGAAALALRDRLGGRRVGVMGMSFGGGISLLAAADARFADPIAFVVAVGAHDDLARVSRFFATDEAVEVSGTIHKTHAHEYGPTVLVYSHVEDFFPADDVPAARTALRAWLHDHRDDARAAAATLSPASKARVEKLFSADVAAVRSELLAEVERHADAMAAVSPHGRLAGLRAHVYLAHGAGDSVIPATETNWLAADVPASALRDVLVSPAIVHVELKAPTLLDQLQLVHFMGHVVEEAEDT